MIIHNALSESAVLQDAIVVEQGAWAVESTRVLRTTLGSCVSVCLFDPIVGVGGMNHYVYPPRSTGFDSRLSSNTFSGDLCMTGLLEAVLRAGAKKANLHAKAFGGGRMFEHEDLMSVGKRNVSYAKYWLENAGIPLDQYDFHGGYARKLFFYPRTGLHLCHRLPMAI